MNRRIDPSQRPDDGSNGPVPDDLRAADELLSRALAEWSRADPARAERIHRATVGSIGVPVAPRRITPAASSPGWRWALYVGGGLAAAAMVMIMLRSRSDETASGPAKAPVQVVEGAAPAPVTSQVTNPTEGDPAVRPSAAEPVLVALIERDASRWSEDWTADDSFGHSSAWAAVVPVLETRDTGFDTVAGEIGEILVGGIGGSGGTGGSFR